MGLVRLQDKNQSLGDALQSNLALCEKEESVLSTLCACMCVCGVCVVCVCVYVCVCEDY